MTNIPARSPEKPTATAPFADRHVAADNCFTLIRYVLALCIFCNHLCYASGRDIFLCYGGIFVECFFVISGYLTMNSYVRRDDWRDFAHRRMRRILPGYVSTVFICFAIGIVFTTLPLSDFFSRAETWRYLGSNLLFLNFLQPTLPGLWDHHAMPTVNSSLWTMKIEVLFYLSVPLVTWAIKRWKPALVFGLITFFSWMWYTTTHYIFTTTGQHMYYTLNHQIMGELQFFYFPVLLLWYRDWFVRHERVLTVAALALLVLSYTWLPQAAYFNFFTLSVLLLVVAYRLEAFVHARRWKDVSYEFYLLRFPTLQVCVELLPAVSLPVLAAVSLPVLFALSFVFNLWCKFVSKRMQ